MKNKDAKISVCGISVFAYHGLEKKEAKEGSNFIIDIECWYPEPDKPEADTLKSRPDYAEISYRVIELFKKRRYRLLEPLGAVIADSIMKEFPVLSRFRIRIKKLNPSMKLDLAYSEVIITRMRE